MRTALDRFQSKVQKADGWPPDACWLWLGTKTRTGYGQLSVNRRMVYAHRFSYELANGPIPAGMTLDHLCRVRHCVNPLHLEPCSQWENTRRSPLNHVALNVGKTTCPAGHPYDSENLYVKTNGHRICRVCQREKHTIAQRERRRRAHHAPDCPARTDKGGT